MKIRTNIKALNFRNYNMYTEEKIDNECHKCNSQYILESKYVSWTMSI